MQPLDILIIELDLQLNTVIDTPVKTIDQNGHLVSFFLDKYIGIDLSYEQVLCVKRASEHKARQALNEAMRYRNTLANMGLHEFTNVGRRNRSDWI